MLHYHSIPRVASAASEAAAMRVVDEWRQVAPVRSVDVRRYLTSGEVRVLLGNGKTSTIAFRRSLFSGVARVIGMAR